mmetsp:Transcript_15716/g.27399  ORF Transcript_15716/g.27399 Transcript_15716/m.27399 type:complete len:84 (-) Transcript_15716:2409-2660(-)
MRYSVVQVTIAFRLEFLQFAPSDTCLHSCNINRALASKTLFVVFITGPHVSEVILKYLVYKNVYNQGKSARIGNSKRFRLCCS